MTRDIPELPVDIGGAAWPVLDRSVAMRGDYRGIASFEELEKIASRNRKASRNEALLRDMTRAIPKGALLGLLAFAVGYGLAPNIHAWWVETGIVFPRTGGVFTWLALARNLQIERSDVMAALPWVIPVAGGVILAALLGMEVGLLLAALVCFALSVPTIPHHLIAFGVCLGGGVLIRLLVELLP